MVCIMSITPPLYKCVRNYGNYFFWDLFSGLRSANIALLRRLWAFDFLFFFSCRHCG